MSDLGLPPSWRATARLARREVRRRPWRTALVVAMVGLPVAAVTAAATVARTVHVTVADEWAQVMGRADDYVEAPALSDERRFATTARDAYPEGSRFRFVTIGPDGVTGRDGHLHGVEYSDHPVADPLLEGVFELTGGRAPREAGEVAVTPAVLEVAGARLGDRIDLLRTGAARVTGVVRDPSDFERRQVIGTTPPPPHRATTFGAFVDAPPGSAPDRGALEAIGAHSKLVFFDQWAGDHEDLRRRVGSMYVLGGVALAVVAIVASSAFAVGARRQLRTLGLLAASGAPPAALRRAVLLQGTVTGAVGSAVGVALGVAAAAALHPYLDDINDRAVGSLDVEVLDLVVGMVLGTAAATAACWFPARNARRVPVLAALAGRRPAGRLPLTVPLGGAVATGAGVIALGIWARQPQQEWRTGLVSAFTVLGGAVALAPWVVSHVEPLARRLRGAARIAARDLARQRLRSAAVVAAVMAPAGLSVVGAVSVATSDAREAAWAENALRDDEVLVDFNGSDLAEARDEVEAVAEVLPDAVQVEVGAVAGDPARSTLDIYHHALLQVPPQTGARPVGAPGVVDDDLRTLQVVDPDELSSAGTPRRVVAALEDGKVVLAAPWPDGEVAVVGADVALAPGDVVRADTAFPHAGGGGLVAPATVERWGLRVVPVAVVLRAPQPLSRAQVEAVRRIADRGCHSVGDPGCDGASLRSYLRGEGTFDVAGITVRDDLDEAANGGLVLHLVTVGGSLLFTLAVVAVALALTAAESRDERALLRAIGAGPQTHRSMAAWQALLLPGMATLLAVPISLGVGWVLQSEPHVTGVGPQVPWLTLALLIVALPLATSGVAWLGASLTGRRHRDLSTLALAAD